MPQRTRGIAERDFSQLMSALEELVATRDLKTLTSGFIHIASPGQLSELKKVWRTWAQLSTLKRRWVTERREAAFKRDSEVETVMCEYLIAVPQNHKESVGRWRAGGLFGLQCEASILTRENVTFTGSPFQTEKSRGDYDFSPRPCVLPFTGWITWRSRRLSSMIPCQRCTVFTCQRFCTSALKG